MKRLLAVVAGLLGLVAVAYAARTVYTGPLVYESALTYNKNYSLNVSNNGIDTLAATASYSSATVASQSFTDGTQSTGSVTVTTVTGLAGSRGTNTLTVLSTSSISGSSISLGGNTLTESIQWYAGQTSTATVAESIKTAVNAIPQFSATRSFNIVTVTCVASGTWCNNVPLSVIGTSSITAGAATFSGGVDNAIVSINSVNLIQGIDWTVGASTAATAFAISNAINANSALSAVLTATAPATCASGPHCGVVVATTTAVGTVSNYALFSSSQAALTLSGSVTSDSVGRGTSAMTGGTNSAYTLNSPSITIASNPFWSKATANGQASMVALPVLYSTGSVAIGGLVNQTTYYVIPVDANTFKLASTSANAQAGTAITITSSSTQTTAHTYTLAPLAIGGTPSFKWQVSNDGSLWQDFTTTSSGVAVSSVTIGSYTLGGASTSWDFGPFGYTYIRLAVISPTSGGLNLLVTMNGKSTSSR